jgi:hypothetical protein
MAYCSHPSCSDVLFWRVGSGTARVVGHSSSGNHAALAAGPNGRIWVLWAKANRVFARRSNPAVNAFGATVSVGPPRGTIALYQLDAEARTGRSTSS